MPALLTNSLRAAREGEQAMGALSTPDRRASERACTLSGRSSFGQSPMQPQLKGVETGADDDMTGARSFECEEGMECAACWEKQTLCSFYRKKIGDHRPSEISFRCPDSTLQ
eukprot:592403_1